MYDVIVIGARCAGSPTAMLLARRGYRVMLVDRATFPSDTISTHIIWQHGVARLERWGLLERLAASNCPPIHTLTFDVGEFALAGTLPAADGVSQAYAPRRTVLDSLLVEAAVSAGADLHEGFAVTEIITDGERVAGVRGRGANGTSMTEQAGLIIGADGLHSIVARTVSAPEYDIRGRLACWYYTYWSGIEVNGIEMIDLGGSAAALIPTNDGLVCVPVAIPSGELVAFRGDVESSYLRTLERSPSLAVRLEAGRREEPLRAMANVPNLFRKPYGSGWALVGDAAYHKDPVTAQGISDAFRDAEALAEAVDAGLSGRQRLEEALAAYEQRRNAASAAMFEYTCALATLEPPPDDLLAVLTALRGNLPDTNRFLGTIAGTVPVAEFFAPENVERILAASQRPSRA